MKKLIILLALLVLASSACAETKTIHSDPVIISYSPEDALFYVDAQTGEVLCVEVY